MNKKPSKEKYLADPELCPYCGDEHIYCIDEPDGALLMEWLMLNKDIPLDMQCGSCDGEWVKIHRHKVNDVEFKTKKKGGDNSERDNRPNRKPRPSAWGRLEKR